VSNYLFMNHFFIDTFVVVRISSNYLLFSNRESITFLLTQLLLSVLAPTIFCTPIGNLDAPPPPATLDSEHLRNSAIAQIRALQKNPAYKKHGKTFDYVINVIQDIVLGDRVLILQLLCPVNGSNSLLARILKRNIEPNLSYGGESLHGLSEELRAVTATVRAYDSTFKKHFSDWKIIVINCRDQCILNKTGDHCKICMNKEGEALVKLYTVLGRIIRDMSGEVAFVSFAGTTSGVQENISTPLAKLRMHDGTPIFKHIFGNGYHLSLLTYFNKDCFGTVEHQVKQVTACIIDLCEMFGKTDLLPFFFIDSNIPIVQEPGECLDDLLSKISRDNYRRLQKFGVGLGGYNDVYARQKASGGGPLVDERSRLGKEQYEDHSRDEIGLAGYNAEYALQKASGGGPLVDERRLMKKEQYERESGSIPREQQSDWGTAENQRELKLKTGLPAYNYNQNKARCEQLREYWSAVSVLLFPFCGAFILIHSFNKMLKSFSITHTRAFTRMILRCISGVLEFVLEERLRMLIAILIMLVYSTVFISVGKVSSNRWSSMLQHTNSS
jgi:hypothetical protein